MDWQLPVPLLLLLLPSLVVVVSVFAVIVACRIQELRCGCLSSLGNTMNTIRETIRINEREAELGIEGDASWHAKWKVSSIRHCMHQCHHHHHHV
jgi:hypothetical protein